MNTPHTPGPWCVFNPRLRTNPSSEHRLLVLHPDGERIVARMDEGFVNGKGTMTLEEREANARLIAAAPAMYLALKDVLADYDLDPANAGETEYSYIQSARAAINLATGQTP